MVAVLSARLEDDSEFDGVQAIGGEHQTCSFIPGLSLGQLGS
jgi:hypothetical protein